MVKNEVRTRHFTPNEVALHNTTDDIWVSFLGKVYDLNPLVKKYRGDILLKPIFMFAGKDITHWFNAETRDIRTHADPQTGCLMPYTPHGCFIHIPPPYPCSDWSNDFEKPWWRDDLYCIGNLSQKTRFIKIINTLTSQENIVEVCSEETISEILQRYLKHNSHANSYTWKYTGKNLDMDKTLAENRIMDDDEELYQLRMNDEEFLPAVHLYFNDDLTEA